MCENYASGIRWCPQSRLVLELYLLVRKHILLLAAFVEKMEIKHCRIDVCTKGDWHQAQEQVDRRVPELVATSGLYRGLEGLEESGRLINQQSTLRDRRQVPYTPSEGLWHVPPSLKE